MKAQTASTLAAVASGLFVLALRPGPLGGVAMVAAGLGLLAFWFARTRSGALRVGFILGLAPSSVALGAFSPISPLLAAVLAVLVALSFSGVGLMVVAPTSSWLLLVFRVALAWTALEYLWSSSWLLGPFRLPFLTLGSALTDTPLLPFAAVVGPRGLTLFTWFVAGLLLAPWFMLGARKAMTWWSATMGAALLAVIGVLPSLLSTHSLVSSADETFVSLRVVQHAPTPTEMAAARFDPTVAQAHADLLAFRSDASEVGERLVVWPEASLLEPWNVATPAPAWLPEGVSILLGGAIEVGESIRNAGLLWHGDALSVVHEKRVRVPFVERELVAGEARPPLLWNGTNIGVLLCYEVLFSDVVRDVVQGGAEVVIVLANDAYAGNSTAPLLHARMARLRAAELGVPVVFVQATGPSKIWDADGAMLDETPRKLVTTLDQELPVSPIETPYLQSGDLVGVASLVVTLLLLLPFGFARHGRRKGGEA